MFSPYSFLLKSLARESIFTVFLRFLFRKSILLGAVVFNFPPLARYEWLTTQKEHCLVFVAQIGSVDIHLVRLFCFLTLFLRFSQIPFW
jgi:hypothetical protein